MDFSDIVGIGKDLIGLGQGAAELVKGIKDLNAGDKPESKKLIDSAAEALRDKVMELQQKQLELHQAAMALTQQNIGLVKTNHAMEMELSKLKAFDADRSKFDRVMLAFNSFAYCERGFDGPADKQPLLCPNCFDNAKKTYLSFKEHVAYANALTCTVCDTAVHVPRNEGSAVRTAPVRRSSRWDDIL